MAIKTLSFVCYTISMCIRFVVTFLVSIIRKSSTVATASNNHVHIHIHRNTMVVKNLQFALEMFIFIQLNFFENFSAAEICSAIIILSLTVLRFGSFDTSF